MQHLMEIDRRDLLTRAMALLGATALAGCKFLPGAKAPAEMPADLLKLLGSFADTLIPQTDTPGAVAAGVPRKVAQMYHDWASDATRADLTGALERIEAEARKAKGKGFAELAPAERQTFLAAHDKAAMQDVPPPKDAPKGSPFAPIVSVADNGYAKLKELVAVTYFMSEAALTTELEYEHVPGGWTASVKVTPKTKPAVSFGAF